jgi:hypothetical protein
MEADVHLIPVTQNRIDWRSIFLNFLGFICRLSDHNENSGLMNRYQQWSYQLGWSPAGQLHGDVEVLVGDMLPADAQMGFRLRWAREKGWVYVILMDDETIVVRAVIKWPHTLSFDRRVAPSQEMETFFWQVMDVLTSDFEDHLKTKRLRNTPW